MPLPANGAISASDVNVEIQRASNAAFSMNDSAVRVTAGKPSGIISFGDLRGKTYEFVYTLANNQSVIDAKALFTLEQWENSAPKRVIVPEGVTVGSPFPASPGFRSNIGRGGDLILEVHGNLYGAGGVANSGEGGDAVLAEQAMKLILGSTGVIKSGGGGGSKGGQGGNGSYAVTVREPTSGAYGGYYSSYYFYSYYHPGSPSTEYGEGTSPGYYGEIRWAGSILYSGSGPPNPYTTGNVTYYPAGTAIYRTYPSTAIQIGPLGGDGGRGDGFGDTITDGSNGVAGTNNAGASGKGGFGGAKGANGVVGVTGSNGNSSNGVAAVAAGLTGYALRGLSFITLTNNGGTIAGREG